MASEVTVKFEFEIGELVFIKGAQHSDQARPKQFVIFERIAQQCHADMQRLYRLIGYGEGSSFGVPEIALTRVEPPYREKSNTQLLEEFHLTEGWRNVRKILKSDEKAQESDKQGSGVRDVE
jgi:hypothetical protein